MACIKQRATFWKAFTGIMVSILLLSGCGSPPKAKISAAGNSTDSGKHCYNGGNDSQYSCDTKALTKQPDLRTYADEQWSNGKLNEIKQWLKEQKAKTAAPSSLPNPSKLKEYSNPEITKAMLLNALQEHQQALNTLDTLLESEGNNTEAKLAKGIVLLESGDLDSAERLFKGMTKQLPHLPEAYNNLAAVYVKQGKYQTAIETLTRAFSTHPSYQRVHSNLKLLYSALANQTYNKALDLHSSSATHEPQLLLIDQLPESKKRPLEEKAQPCTQGCKKKVKDRSTETEENPDISEVKLHLKQWSGAWSAQDYKGYISSYSPNYHPDDEINHQQWADKLQQRLTNPEFIKINLSEISVKFIDENSAELHFIQHYQSNSYQDRVKKQMIMIKEQQGWKITLEKTLGDTL